jgi:membrane associated rhomboid family serine protease
MVQYGLQVAPPLWINGVVYPSLGHFMSKEGFIHKADGPKHFSMWTPISLWSSWLLVIVMYRTGEAPRRAWFDRHMTCSYDNRSRPWGLLTSAFTHVAIPHFLMNSAALFAMTKNLGTNSPLPLWAMFSIISFFASTFSVVLSVSIAKLLLHRGIVRPGLLTRSVGASGGLTGLFAINALTHQDKKVNLRILPVEFELIDLLALLMGIDVLGFMLQICGKNTGISHSGHLGGYISGIVLMNIMKKKYEKTYPPGSYEDYINWAENIYFPKPRNDIYIPAQDTSGVLIKHRTAHNTYLR